MEEHVPARREDRGSPLRVAVAGTGFIGAVHARSARLAGAQLAGVAASSPARSQEAAARLGAERAFASSEELVQADDIDVVHVCTPNRLHLPLAEAALAAGKHVICEKPLALDEAGARRLVDAAAAADRTAAVPFVYRYYPTVREARERVRRGATGPLRLLHGTYLQDWLLRAEDDNWRVDAELGGASRTFADIGSHWCDLAEFVSGHRITRLSARMLTALPQRLHAENRAAFSAAPADGEVRDVTTEDAAVVQFETDRGALGTLVVSQISAGRKNRLWLELDGAEEALAFDQEEPETLWVGRREAATLLRRDPGHMSPAAARLATLPPGHPQGYADCFDLFVADVYAEIRGETPRDGVPTFHDGLRAAQIIEAVLASSREERWVDVAAAEPAGVVT
jgi:predicted dehydrogenase